MCVELNLQELFSVGCVLLPKWPVRFARPNRSRNREPYLPYFPVLPKFGPRTPYFPGFPYFPYFAQIGLNMNRTHPTPPMGVGVRMLGNATTEILPNGPQFKSPAAPKKVNTPVLIPACKYPNPQHDTGG